MSAAGEIAVSAMATDPKEMEAGMKAAVVKPAKEKKPRAPKAAKEKKAKGSKPSSPSHPSYFQMIKEAILVLKEKSGSSPYAIAKCMEEKHKGVLPANYKKMLTVQLRNCVAKGKLLKVKGSFKLSETGKKDVVKKPLAVKEKKPKSVSSGTAKGKATADAKKKKAEDAKKTKPVAASKPRSKPAAKPKQPKSIKSPAKAVKKPKRAAAAKPKQPKSIKSPASKRARRAAA